jgi:hypothetical protein
MSKYLGALMLVLGLSLFGAGAVSAFTSPSETVATEGDGKDKKKKKNGKKHKKHKKHGKKKKKDNK